MKAKVVIAMSAVLAIVAVAWLLAGSRALASATSDKAEIIALNRRVADAISKGDLDAVMACYVDDQDVIFYEDTMPFQFKGRSAVRKYIQDLFANASQIHDEMKAISTVVSGNLAAAHYTLTVSWTDKSGAHSERGRYTQVLEKVS